MATRDKVSISTILFQLQLVFVIDMRKLAAAALEEIPAFRLYAMRRRLEHFLEPRLSSKRPFAR